MQTIDIRIPKYKLSESIIGTNPGLGFRPSPAFQNIESSLIWYKGTAEKDYKYWVDSLNEFLQGYLFFICQKNIQITFERLATFSESQESTRY